MNQHVTTGSERGGTSIPGGPVKPLMTIIEDLVHRDAISRSAKILDYGAGRYQRNAHPLRRLGFRVYAYDPYWGTAQSGWIDVSDRSPQIKFDLVFTSYVLNVVSATEEDTILTALSRKAPRAIHVTRNHDVRDMITNALYRYMDGATDKNAQTVGRYFVGTFASDAALRGFDRGELYREDMQEFAQHGVPTSKGFQRIPILETKGYRKVRSTGGFKIYTRGI